MKNMKIISKILLSMFLFITAENNLTFAISTKETEEKVFTSETADEIAANKDNIYGSPNKYWNEETGEFIIPDGYTRVESFIINNQTNRGNTICEKVKHVYVPDSVKIIEKGSFSECYIETVGLPKDLKEISEGLFALSCLKKITLPDNLEKISLMAFHSTHLEEIEIPDSVVEMEDSIFSNCYYLKKIKLPQNLKYISEEMFYSAVSLKEINIPDSVVSIGKTAFADTGIKTLKLPKNLKKIDRAAFWFCTDLESLEMPSVISLGDYVFSNCEKLNRLVVSSEFFKSKDISPKAFSGEEENFYSSPPEPVKENSVDVFVTDGISGLNISEIKAQNKWIRSIQSLNQETESSSNSGYLPNTGLANTKNLAVFVLALSLGIFCVLNKKQKI